MDVTVAEFKADIDQYLELAGEEEIVITKDGKSFVKMAPVSGGFAEYLVSLQGILPETVTVEEAHEERMARHERHF